MSFHLLRLYFEKVERNVRFSVSLIKKNTESTYLENRTLKKELLERGNLHFLVRSLTHTSVYRRTRKTDSFCLGINANFLWHWTIKSTHRYIHSNFISRIFKILFQFCYESSFLQALFISKSLRINMFDRPLILGSFCAANFFLLTISHNFLFQLSSTKLDANVYFCAMAFKIIF